MTPLATLVAGGFLLMGSIQGYSMPGGAGKCSQSKWKNDAGMKASNEFVDKYYPEANRADLSVMYGCTVAQGLAQVLKACAPISQLQLMKFKGETWERFGDILSGDVGG
jgi:branched-chain amino acid transport system substrate-binding protein